MLVLLRVSGAEDCVCAAEGCSVPPCSTGGKPTALFDRVRAVTVHKCSLLQVNKL